MRVGLDNLVQFRDEELSIVVQQPERIKSIYHSASGCESLLEKHWDGKQAAQQDQLEFCNHHALALLQSFSAYHPCCC